VTSRSFQHPRTVAADDIDVLGHASNIAFLRWIQDVAWAHSDAVGWDLAAYQKLGAVFVVRRHEIDYLAPAFAGDELVVETGVGEWKAATSQRWTKIRRGDKEVARALTHWVLVTLEGRPRRIPPEISKAFGL
jgi:acyl-CoA thioester hydrolase